MRTREEEVIRRLRNEFSKHDPNLLFILQCEDSVYGYEIAPTDKADKIYQDILRDVNEDADIKHIVYYDFEHIRKALGISKQKMRNINLGIEEEIEETTTRAVSAAKRLLLSSLNEEG